MTFLVYNVSVRSAENTENMKRTFWKKKPPNLKSVKKRNLRIPGHETTQELKKDIQALVREIAIKRDGGCVLRNFPEAGPCGWLRNDGQLILQAEHLVTRSNSASYGDMRNIVCLCAHHHSHFKPQFSRLYWSLIRKIIGKVRWDWVERVEADKTPHKVDWKLVKLALQQEKTRLDCS